MHYLQLVSIIAGINLVASECGGFTLPQVNHVTYRRNNIVGGNVATNRSAFSYQASLMLLPNLDYHCGAVIINPKHLLTAAHCVFNNGTVLSPNLLCVVAGHLSILQEEPETQYRDVERTFIFPNYKDVSLSYDIALIKIYKEYDSPSASISALPLAAMTPFDNTQCIVSGWGATSEIEYFSAVLQYAEVVIISKQWCSLKYDGLIDKRMLCAGHIEGGRDSCQGDSGGPLVCNGQLVGIVSWGEGCALEGFPGVYTDVTTYRRWIDTQIAIAHQRNERARSSSSSTIASTIENHFVLLVCNIFLVLSVINSKFHLSSVLTS